MSEERCIRTDLFPAECACLKHRGGDIIDLDNHAPTVVERTPVSRPFQANYPGKCVCSTKFAPSDLIAYNGEDELVGTQCCTGDL